MKQETIVSGNLASRWLDRARAELAFLSGDYLYFVISALLIDASIEMGNTYYPLYVKAIGGSASVLSLIAGAGTVVRAFAMLYGGQLADKYNKKWIVVIGVFGTGVSYLFYAFAPRWEYILVGHMIAMVCQAYGPAYNAIVIEMIPQEKRGLGYSILGLITRVSTTPSPLIAGYLYSSYGLVQGTRYAYVVVVAAYFVGGLLRTVIKDAGDGGDSSKELSLNIGGILRDGWEAYGHLPEVALRAYGLQIVHYMSWCLFFPTIKLFISENLGVDPGLFSSIFCVVALTNILAALPVGVMIDRYGKKNFLVAGLAGYAVSTALLYIGGINMVYASFILGGIAMIMFESANSALWADMIPAEYRGRILGVNHFVGILVSTIGIMAGGYLYDYVNPWMPLHLFTGISVILFFGYLLLVKEPEVVS